MATPSNICPLCGKDNPITEWVCADCGAKLPLYGQQTTEEATEARSYASYSNGSADTSNVCGRTAATAC